MFSQSPRQETAGVFFTSPMVKKKLWVERLLTGDGQFSRRLPFQITLPHGHLKRLNVARKALVSNNGELARFRSSWT